MATVEDLYRQILGREPDPEGLAFWQSAFGGSVDPMEQASFMQAAQAELARRTPAEQAVLAPNLVAAPAPPPAVTNADILGWFNANPNADEALVNQTMQAAGVPPSQVSSALASNPDVAKTYLTQQILGQGTTDKWTGEGKGSAQANASDMASILAGIGITDINQFGQITKEVPQYSTDEYGNSYSSGTQTITTFGNKVTGQEVPNTYSERQSGNAFGGTFAGKGNTGYRVEFDAQGKPLFYTTGASSSDVPSWVAPALVLGGAYFGLDAAGLLGGAGGSLTAGITAADIAAAEAALPTLSGAGAAAGATGLLGGSLTAGITPAQIAAAEAALPSVGGSLTAGITAADIAAGEAALPTAGSLTAGITASDIAASEAGLPATGGSLTAGITPTDIAAAETGLPVTGSLTSGITTADITAGETALPSTGITTNVGDILSNLTPNQIANIISGLGGLLGGAAITSGGGTRGGVGALPTQGVPLNTADYYNAIQQNYNRLLPSVPRDVSTPLAQWYNSTYGA